MKTIVKLDQAKDFDLEGRAGDRYELTVMVLDGNQDVIELQPEDTVVFRMTDLGQDVKIFNLEAGITRDLDLNFVIDLDFRTVPKGIYPFTFKITSDDVPSTYMAGRVVIDG